MLKPAFPSPDALQKWSRKQNALIIDSIFIIIRSKQYNGSKKNPSFHNCTKVLIYMNAINKISPSQCLT